MKPQPPPSVPGDTPAARMSNALRHVLTVPKDAILKAEAKLKLKKAKRASRPKTDQKDDTSHDPANTN
jgi:hypothetical protein